MLYQIHAPDHTICGTFETISDHPGSAHIIFAEGIRKLSQQVIDRIEESFFGALTDHNIRTTMRNLLDQKSKHVLHFYFQKVSN